MLIAACVYVSACRDERYAVCTVVSLRSDVGVLLYIHVQVHVVYVPCVCPQCVLVVREFPTLL